MKADQLERKIQKNIRNNLNQKDLVNLCIFLNLQITGRKSYIQDKLLEYITTVSNNTLLEISNQIDKYMRPVNNKTRQVNNTKIEQLTESFLKKAPVDLLSEVPDSLRSDLISQNVITNQNQFTLVPTQAATNPNDFANFVNIPNVIQSVSISTSPFYCCSVCLHPLTLLVPSQMPITSNKNRVTSKAPFTFTMTENVKKILNKNMIKVNDRIDYKWQINLRFVGLDPSQKIPTFEDKVTETIPQHLQVTVNGVIQPLWEILPSNCLAKEGKRHPKPVNISDKIIEKSRSSQGYDQYIIINWCQVPGVYMYYYLGIYLERKLYVKEMMSIFTPSNQFNNRPIEDTYKLIRKKLGDISKNTKKDDDDEDLVISKVLPINLCCPVGKSRISIPLRTVTCQHLQCFDAQLFLSMNERRSVWKCPVCDNQATPNDLFCDKFFDKILKHFQNDNGVTEVNVNADFSFVAIKHKGDRGKSEHKLQENVIAQPIPERLEHSLIVLDSDEEPDTEQSQIEFSSLIGNDIDIRKNLAVEIPDSQLQTALINNKESNQNQIINDYYNNNETGEILPVLNNIQVSLGTNFVVNTSTVENTIYKQIYDPENNFLHVSNSQTSHSTSADSIQNTSNIPSLIQHTIDYVTSLAKSDNQVSSQELLNFSSTDRSLYQYTQSKINSDARTSTIHYNEKKKIFLKLPITITPLTKAFPTLTENVLDTTISNSITTSNIVMPKTVDNVENSLNNLDNVSSILNDSVTTASSISVDPLNMQDSNSKTIIVGCNENITFSDTSTKDPDNSDIVHCIPLSESTASSKQQLPENQSPDLISFPNITLFNVDPVSKENEISCNVTSDLLPHSPSPLLPPLCFRSSEISQNSTIVQHNILAEKELIPEVTIDLTNDDDEIPSNNDDKVMSKNHPFNGRLTWVPVSKPISRNMKLNGLTFNNKNRFSFYDKIAYKDTVLTNKIPELPVVNYFQTYQMGTPGDAVGKSQHSIDLTADDDDDEDILPKRFKLNNFSYNSADDYEDGQLDDSESCSSENSLIYNSKKIVSTSRNVAPNI